MASVVKAPDRAAVQRRRPGGPNSESCCGWRLWRASTEGRCENIAGDDIALELALMRNRDDAPPSVRGPTGRWVSKTAEEAKGRGGIGGLSR